MDVKIEKTGTFGRKVQVTLPVKQVDTAFASATRAIAKTARIPGFRPGKAPRGVIEAHYGDELRAEVERSLVSVSLVRALEQTEAKPVAMPRVDAPLPKRGTVFSYSAEFEVEPNVILERYEGLEIEKVETTIDERQVEDELEQLRHKAAELVPVLIRDDVQRGDVATIDYVGSIDGSVFPGGQGEGAMVEVGGEDYLPGFSQALEGAKVGSAISFPIDFPEDYTAEELAGKTATFQVTIKDIKTRELPALNDDFAKDLDADSLSELRSTIKERLQLRREAEAQEERHRKILEALVEANRFEVPESMVKQQAQANVRTSAERMQNLMGGQFELTQEDIEHLLAENHDTAKFQVQSALLVAKLRETLGLVVSEDHVQAEIERLVSENLDNEDRVRALFAAPEERNNLRRKLEHERAIEHLLATSQEIAADSSTSPDV